MAAAIGADPAEFDSDSADFSRRMLMRFGYVTVRRREDLADGPPDGQEGPSYERAEALQPFPGKYVALRDDEVLVEADSFDEIVKWLRRHQFPGV